MKTGEETIRRLSGFRQISLPLLLTFLVLAAYGLIMLFSASLAVSYAREGAATDMILKQALISGAGLIVAFFVAFLLPIRKLNRPIWRYLVYAVVTLFLVAVWLVGTTINGAQRWIYIGPISFQPSELAKLGAVFFLATYFPEMAKKRRQGKLRHVRPWLQGWYNGFVDVTLPALLMAFWAVLIALQPHMSGAIIFTLVVVFMFAAASLPMSSYLKGGLLLLLVLLIVGLLFVTLGPQLSGKTPAEFVGERFAHVFNRLTTYQNPEAASSDDIRQVAQARIALGSGGLFGVGLGKSVQKLNWLPESHNDFILPIIGEELGFAGTFLCLLLFVLFFFFGFRVAHHAASQMPALIAAGFTFLITLQALLNFGVSTEILPVTGVSLPFFSYGGTANFFFMVAAGMVLCVSKSGQLEDKALAGLVKPTRRKSEAARRSIATARPAKL